MNPLEHVGNLYIENQRLLGEYRKLLELVDRIAAGDVPTSQVRVNMKDLSWEIVLGQEKPTDDDAP